MFEKLKKKSKDPSVNIFLRLMDMDGTSPKTFYIMDEVEGKQILREYDWSSELPEYCQTYEVLFKTEVNGRFCVIMRRNRYTEAEPCYVMEYYPGTQGRIFMKGLSEANMNAVVEEYTKYAQRQMKRLPFVRRRDT